MVSELEIIMTKESLLAALGPHLPVVTELIRAAVEEYESFDIPPNRRLVLDGAPSGIAIYHLIWDHIERRFGRVGPVRVAETDGLKFLFFEDPGVAIRVNKLDALSLTGPLSREPRKLNNHPQLFLSFHDEPPGHLIFGYTKRLNAIGVAVLDRIVLTLENEDGVQWCTYIDDADSTALPAEPTPSPTPPVVRPKALPDELRKADDKSAAG